MSEIELKAEDLYDQEKVDLEKLEMEEVWQLLQCVFRLNCLLGRRYHISLSIASFRAYPWTGRKKTVSIMRRRRVV